MNFAKFLRTPFLQNTSGRLLLGITNAVLCLSTSLIGICQYVLFKSRTVKTSASYILSRIFSAFGIGKDFGIVLAFSFQKPQHKRIEQSRFSTGVIGLEYGRSLCSIMPFSSNSSNCLKISL